MKKFQLTLILLFAISFCFQAQTLLVEDFEAGTLPTDWSIQTNATDGGWNIGSSAELSSAYWSVPDNGSSRIAATNDDACNCDKSADYLVTPAMDFMDVATPSLKFDLYFQGQTFQGSTEEATVEVSLDGINWQVIESLEGAADWVTHAVDLSAYAGETSVFIGFRYQDNGGWLYGFAVDNVSIEIPPTIDAGLADLNSLPYGETERPFPLTGQIYNAGISPITSLELSYSIDGGTPTVENLSGLNIAPFSTYDFEVSSPWVPDAAGTVEVAMEIISVNGGADENMDNNSASFETEIYSKVVPPNKIDDYMAAPPVVNELSIPSTQIDKPTDLDFFPILGKDELWVINERNENSGGSTLTLIGASTDDPDLLHRVDGNAWHFMSLPTGIAFSSDNFNFASSPGVKDANHSGGTFTGPTLWSSDPEIYAQPSGGNGSHLDMLHGSPFSMGIAHEVDNVFWVYDDWNSDIVRYDFVDDHGPGNDDHSDAIVRRYENIGIEADGDIPNHMVLDKTTGWLYVVDNGNDRVFRLDINSGTFGGNLPLINEQLAEHSEYINFTVENIVEAGLEQPCGIEIMENRLLVGDYATGDIVVFDMDNNFIELGRIPTGEPGLTGITIGPDGSIWCTNRTLESLYRLDPGEVSNAEEEAFSAQIQLSPNPTSGMVLLRLPEETNFSEVNIEITDLTGRKVMSQAGASAREQLDLNGLPNGLYLLLIQSGEFSVTKRIVVER